MLEVEDKSFGIVQNEVPKGYGKIEVKNDQGTLAINCQNLKTGNKSSRYRWYLINTKKESDLAIVEVGPMEVDQKGKGEVIWEFNAENVRGSMEEIDNFNMLVLVAQNKDDKKSLFIPLVGYMDKEKSTSWRYALEKHLYIPPKEKLPTYTEELQEHIETDKEYIPIKDGIEEIIQDLKQEEVQEVKLEELEDEIELSQISKDDIKEEIKEVIEELSIKEEIKEDIKEVIEEPFIKEDIKEVIEEPTIKKVSKTVIEKEIEEEINDEESYGVQMQGYIENALKDLPTVNPFASNFQEYTWWQIPYNYQTIYRSYMPFISYIDSIKGPVNYYASKMLQTIYLHQHHIFGVLYDTKGVAKYYAYGIPGRKHPSEQPYEGATGFTYWHPCHSGPNDMYSHGYWILLVDPKTGKTIKDLQL